ncbi:MAG: polysaccharide deacetylase family protein [Chitinophagaceae bacterium]
MFYLVKTPGFVEKYIFPRFIWSMSGSEKSIYLSFDDGPHPTVTHFVLDQLKGYNAKATFFCIGKNVLAYPDIYKRIISEGHTIGNHTHDHLNGGNTNVEYYLQNIATASPSSVSVFFGRPSGRISRFQAKQVLDTMKLRIVMWSVLSGDFDMRLSGEDCYKNILGAMHPGAIVVFHDSEKAMKRMKYTLPRMLENFTEQGYTFKSITF